ncbi:UDP-glucose 4-epimerase GalE [Halobacillus litoralis]|uniref:UDP-glucose 4-epimerase n=1 Tax=Halobacillus litoralis TaxID=45668 RepID=A0A845E515_9BACI|nr:UDP-glucose 4-epimerase GalE [Halobacillus litoralis]MYL20744.1 UDP-glucose 4-epimerase GalE [Halobacillus litoralis]
MNILVTGGAGYIGSHTTVALIESGYNVIIADNLSNSSISTKKNLETITNQELTFYNIDVADNNALENVFSNHHIEGVIHFAGYKSVSESVEKPLYYYNNNLISTLTLLNVCEKFSVNKFVFSSSATVYGDNKPPLTEKMLLSPTKNPYGETKVMCERMLSDIAKSKEHFSVAILRYFNPVGAHESGLIGEAPNGIPNNLMPFVSQVAKGKHKKLNIFGDDYQTLDGTGVRDYIHVVDLAIGHVAALDNLTNGVHYYNLGTGRGTSVLELVKAFERANDVEVPYDLMDRRPGDIAECYADVSKAEKELGWTAKRDIIEMCRDAWRFEKKHHI